MIIQSISQITLVSRPKYLIILDIAIDNLSYYVKTKREILEANVIKSILLTTHILASGFLRRLYRVEAILPKEYFNPKIDRYLIVANHYRAIDPYLILATLPFNSFRSLLPIRFFTANIYFQRWWQRIFLQAFGSFRAYSVENKLSGVKGGLYLSDKGQSLLIFPEGKRVAPNLKVELKIGVACLVQHRDFTILPAYIDYGDRKTKINWGKPFKVNDKMKSTDLNTLAKLIFNRVLQLSAQK